MDTKNVPLGGVFRDGRAEVFIDRGVNGRRSEALSDDQSRAYEARWVEALGEECAQWLATGELT